MLFNIGISDLDEWVKRMLVKSADDTVVKRTANILEDQIRIQNDFDIFLTGPILTRYSSTDNCKTSCTTIKVDDKMGEPSSVIAYAKQMS